MKLKSIIGGLALMLTSSMAAHAADPVKFALCYDLSKAYTFVTPQVAQAAKDYAELLNAKGGLEGHPIEVIVQDHGNEPQRGIECYERLKREGVMVFDMLSTPVSRAVPLGTGSKTARCSAPKPPRSPFGSDNPTTTKSPARSRRSLSQRSERRPTYGALASFAIIPSSPSLAICS